MSDLYPHDSAFYATTPQEQIIDEASMKSKVKGALPFIEELMERLESRITFYDTLSSIPDEVQLIPEDFMHTVAANKLAARNLRQELTWITTLYEQYK